MSTVSDKKLRNVLSFQLFFWSNGDERLVGLGLAESHNAVGEREERVVFAHAYVFSGIVYGATLTNDNVASENALSTVYFDAESLRC